MAYKEPSLLSLVEFDPSKIRIYVADESDVTIRRAYSRLAAQYDCRPRVAQSEGGIPEEDYPA